MGRDACESKQQSGLFNGKQSATSAQHDTPVPPPCNTSKITNIPRARPRFCSEWGPRTKAESGGGVLGKGSAIPSPPARGSGGVLRVPPTGFGPPKGFPLFSALRMASPDSIILLIVDYHAAIGGKTPMPPPLRTPLEYS